MKQRFEALWKRLGAEGDPEKAFGRLDARYSEEGRHYHTLEHIEECLDELDGSKHLAEDPDAIEFAIWYHDVEYDTKAKDNEEKSGLIAVDAALEAGLSEDECEYIHGLIMATSHLTNVPGTIDEKLIVDIDLAKLGKAEREFDEYERCLRKEYSWVPEELFRDSRAKILKGFLERESIYFTEFFKAKYEEKARKNLERSIERLKKVKSSGGWI